MLWRGAGGRCEEAELAAGVGMRRAATAEAEAEQLRVTLMEAQKQAKDLGWQVGTSSACAPSPHVLKSSALGFWTRRTAPRISHAKESCAVRFPLSSP